MEKLLILIFFAVLSLLLAATGVSYRKKSKTLSGYIAADRSVSFFAGAFSSFSSVVCGFSVLVLMWGSYNEGARGARSAFLYGAALTVGLFFVWRFMGRRLRIYSELSSNTLTLPSFLESRFKDRSSVLKVVSSVVVIIFSSVYCSFLFTAAAQLLSAASGMSYSLALFMCAVIVSIYILFGGFSAEVFTDILQGFIFFIVMFFLPVYMFDSLDAGSRFLFENDFLSTLNFFENSEDLWVCIINSVFVFLGCFGLPSLFSRFIAMKDKKQIRRAKRLSAIPSAFCIVLVIVTGLFLRQFAVSETKDISVILSQAIADPFMRALVVSALLCAFMSSADSQIMLLSGIIGNDVYPLFRKDADDEERVTVARAAAVVMTFIVCLVSLDSSADISARFLYGFSGFAAAFAPVLFFSMYSRKITLRAAVASIISGTVCTFILWFISFSPLGIFPGCVSLAVSVAVLCIVSAVDRKKPGREIINEFARVNEIMKLR